MYATLIRTVLFIVLGVMLYQQTGAVGIAAIDSVTVAVEAVILLVLLWPALTNKFEIAKTLWRSIAGSIVGIGIIWGVFSYFHVPVVVQITTAIIAVTAVYVVFVTKEVKLLIKL